MKLKRKTKNIFKYIIISFMIIALLLPIVSNFLPQQQSQEIDPKLLEAYINSQKENQDTDETFELPDIEGTYQVVDIPSGDTITIMWGDEKKAVKLIGVKTVSTTKNSLEKQILNDFVQLEFDVNTNDENGNLLAYAYDSDGTFINYDLILHGNAKVETNISDNTKYITELEDAQVLAKNNQAGCWSADNTRKE